MLKNANNEPEVIKLLGTLLLKIGDKKRAINIYEKALSLGVVDIDILNSLGWYALAEKKFEKAADHFNRSLELFRVQVDANLGMGYYHLNLCMYDLAKKHCDVAIKLNAADIRGWELCLFIAHKMNDRVLGKEAYKYIKNLQRDK